MTTEAGLQGRVAISHAFALGDIPAQEAGISIVTSVPYFRVIPPVPLLHKNGVSGSVNE